MERVCSATHGSKRRSRMATSSEVERVGTVEMGGSLLEAILGGKIVLSLVSSLSRGVKDAQFGSCDWNVEGMPLGGIEGRVKHAGTGSLSLFYASWSGIDESTCCPCRERTPPALRVFLNCIHPVPNVNNHC